VTSAADQVVDGFADELEKLGFPARLEKLALFGFGKPKVPAPAPTGGFGKVIHGIKNSPVGKVLGRPLKMLLGYPGMMAFGGVAGLGLMSPKNLRARLQKNGAA
jgi:hypothetical protein